jgi:hypothetical protein
MYALSILRRDHKVLIIREELLELFPFIFSCYSGQSFCASVTTLCCRTMGLNKTTHSARYTPLYQGHDIRQTNQVPMQNLAHGQWGDCGQRRCVTVKLQNANG